jgi:HK97 family phage portal protein
MGLFDIFRRRKPEQRGIYHGTEDTYSVLREPLSDFGLTVSNDAALKMTAYYAGVRLISENIAALPKRIFRDAANGDLTPVNDAVSRAIGVRPNAYTNSFDFWFTMVAWLLNRGNAYALIQWVVDGSVELHQIHPDYVTPVLVKGHKWFHVQLPSTDSRTFLNGDYPDYRMLHFMQFTMDGIVGLNPVVYNAIALGKGAAMEKFIARYFKLGGDKRAVLETDGNLGDDAYNQFLERYKKTGAGGTPLLEWGIKFKQVNVDPVTAALIESETFSIDDIARMLNIPPHMLAELTHATFSNIEHQTIQFVQYTLRPLVKRIEVELESKMFYFAGYSVKFVLEGLLRGDTQARAAFYHGAILDGWMSRNEVRKMEGLPMAEGLDEYLYPTNEMKVGDEPDNTDKQ